MKIVHFPNEILTTKTKQVEVFDDKLFYFVEKMFKILKKENGIGLAANQVGLDKNLFIINVPFAEIDFVRTFVNPSITLSGEFISINEGCLSFPNVTVEVPRYKNCEISYQDLKGNFYTESYEGLLSIVCQHEFDHLNGVTFIDKLPELTRKDICDKVASNEKK